MIDRREFSKEFTVPEKVSLSTQINKFWNYNWEPQKKFCCEQSLEWDASNPWFYARDDHAFVAVGEQVRIPYSCNMDFTRPLFGNGYMWDLA